MYLCNGKTHLFFKDADSNERFVERIHWALPSLILRPIFTMQKMNTSLASIQNRHD
jgi:hypothetical protein